MAVRIGIACLYESTTGQAFGPVFESSFEAEDFLEWYAMSGTEEGAYADVDIRSLNPRDLESLVAKFRKEREEQD